MPTSLDFKVLDILSTLFLAYGSFVKVALALQELSNDIQHDHIQLKLYAPPFMATFHFLPANEKNQIFPRRVALILGNSFHPTSQL